MILFIITAAGFVLYLGAVDPKRIGMPGASSTFGGRLAERRATLVIGLFLIFVFFFTSEWTMWYSTDRAVMTMALCRGQEFGGFQLITSMFVHFTYGHLVDNMFFMALFSLYEKRVGPGRYLAVFFFSGLVTNVVSYLVAAPDVYHAGASAAIYGIIAAYFTDRFKTRASDWMWAAGLISLSVFLAYLSTISFSDSGVKTGHLEHAIGGITGVLFCKIFPRPRPPEPAVKNSLHHPVKSH